MNIIWSNSYLCFITGAFFGRLGVGGLTVINEKYLILQGDGMGDYPLEKLGGKTPLQAAHTPGMDALAKRGKIGLARTIPQGLTPGSDVGNMSILGYDPTEFYTGRAPLEAAGMGVHLDKNEVAFRCNLVKLGRKGNGELFMEDYSAGHISTREGSSLIKRLNRELGNAEFQFYPGTSYRHLMVWKDGRSDIDLTPPHDISGQRIEPYLPRGEESEVLINLTKRSWDIFRGQKANSIWLWGCGKPPQMYSLKDKYSLNGFVISAVDLVKGLGIYAGLKVIEVPGATGFIDTNYLGKVEACMKAIEEMDFGFVHVEAPDEAGHLGDLELKIKAIEDFDEKIVDPILDGLEKFDDFLLMVLTDHYTPLSLKTHSREPVPFVIYRKGDNQSQGSKEFSEKAARRSNIFLEKGHQLLKVLLRVKRLN